MAVLFVSICLISSIQTLLSLLFVLALIARLKRDKSRICIIVLGDIGRSPRMQYHAKSLVLEGYSVDIVGYSGSSVISFLQGKDNVSFNYLFQWPINTPLPGFLNYLLKAAFITIQLFVVLMMKPSFPGFYLVQNPPSIPSLMVTWMISCLRGATMITDWHNYGYTILSMNIKKQGHPLVKFSKWYEGYFGYFSHMNICVTKAMQNDLEGKWNIHADVLYDKPPDHFNYVENTTVKANLFKKLIDSGCFDDCKEHSMWQNLLNLTNPDSKENTGIIISSTSWTEDEDFSILLEALVAYENEKSSQTNLPKLICIITGKGPLKDFYKRKISELKFNHILVTTPWLESDDYPKVIGCGNLGVCLHLSSSGLDLPMKVVDMFGCCLPVCAVNFPCLSELVKHDLNGLTFTDSSELAKQIIELLSSFKNEDGKLAEMRKNLQNGFSKNRWHDNWKKIMLPFLKK